VPGLALQLRDWRDADRRWSGTGCIERLRDRRSHALRRPRWGIGAKHDADLERLTVPDDLELARVGKCCEGRSEPVWEDLDTTSIATAQDECVRGPPLDRG
jgi:hypothetical protein